MMDTYIISKSSNISIPTEANIIYFEDGLNIAPLANEFIFVDKSLAPNQKKLSLSIWGFMRMLYLFKKMIQK